MNELKTWIILLRLPAFKWPRFPEKRFFWQAKSLPNIEEQGARELVFCPIFSLARMQQFSKYHC